MTTLKEIELKLDQSNLILLRADRIMDAIRVEQDALRAVREDKLNQAEETDNEAEYLRLLLEIQALRERGYRLIKRINRVCNYADYHGKMACKLAIESLGGKFQGQPIQDLIRPKLTPSIVPS